MILINSFLHRQRLLEITRRWFYNQKEPSDMADLKAIINYNSIWIGRISRAFSSWLWEHLLDDAVCARSVTSKGALKDLLVENPPYVNQRIVDLIRRYKENPERYFRETPFSGVIYEGTRGGIPAYVGSHRVKRVRRIAEKGARRVSDFIYKQIVARADMLAQQRADALGVMKSRLISSPEEMSVEFERAERRISLEIQRGRLFGDAVDFVLEDVLGFKVIVEDEEQARVIDLLEGEKRCQILEIEHHRGHYSATNVVIRYTPDRDALLAPPLERSTLERLAERGMDVTRAQDAFRDFVLSGEDTIHIELIICNFEQMLESEIGRTMHEDRIVRQRMQQVYRGHLARNVSYLMEYIFACGISPRTEIEQIPIHVWIQYMPDYFDEVLKHLFRIPNFREIE
jgi:hypothetical protein